MGSDDADQTETTNSSARVFVGNLSYRTAWQELKDHMNTGENIVYCDIMKDGKGRSKGCGLVEYESAEEAAKAIESFNDTMLDGRKIFVRVDREPGAGSIASLARRGAGKKGQGSARQGGAKEDEASVFVGNLPFNTSWQELKDLFSKFNPTFAKMSRGYGIVKFATDAEASEAIEEFNETEFESRVLTVRFDQKN